MDQELVRALEPRSGWRLSPLGRSDDLTLKSGERAYLCYKDASGHLVLTEIRSLDQISAAIPSQHMLLAVQTNPFNWTLTFEDLLTSDNIYFTMTLIIQSKVLDPRLLIEYVAYDEIAKSGQSYRTIDLARCVEAEVRHDVADDVGNVKYQELVQDEVLPLPAWLDKLRDWLWHSEKPLEKTLAPPTERIRNDPKRYRHEKERHCFDFLRVDGGYSSPDDEDLRGLWELQRKEVNSHEETLLRLRRQEEILDVQSQIESKKAQRQSTRNKVLGAEEQAADEERVAALHEARRQLQEAQSVAAASGSKDVRMIEDLGGLTSATLQLLGRREPIDFVLAFCRERSSNASRAITLSKTNLQPRSFGLRPKPIGTLTINQSLAFKVQSDRGGYLTLINIGTSGEVLLLAPNRYIDQQRAFIRPRTPLSCPGELLPLPPDYEFVEEGPEGYEQILAIVSDVPLLPLDVHSDVLGSAAATVPIIPLGAGAVAYMQNELEKRSPETWDAHILAFSVVREKSVSTK